MPRLTRKNIKVFAGSATNNGVFGSLQANNPTTTSDVEQLQSLSAWSEGWNAATETSEELPPLEEIQSVSYVTTYQQAYIMQEGIPEWAATVTYYKGCLTKEVTSTGFKIYNSLTDNNTGNLLSDTSNWKKVMDSDDVYAFDNTVVHKTGNEIISGEKTFANTLREKTTGTSDGSYVDFIQEINNARRGTLRTMYNDDGSYSVMLGNNGLDASAPAGITVTRDATKTWAEAPSTPDVGDNSRKIATTAFVTGAINTINNAVVHKTGNETIAGDKTFTGEARIKNLDADYTNPPAGNGQFWGLQGVDKNNNEFGNFRFECDSGRNAAVLNVASPTNPTTFNLLGIFAERNEVYTYAPASDAINSIVTTISKSKSANGYVKLGNGLIVQWGNNSSTTVGRTISFPTAFSGTNYGVSIVSINSSVTGDYTNIIQDKTSTGFKANTNKPISWVAIGY